MHCLPLSDWPYYAAHDQAEENCENRKGRVMSMSVCYSSAHKYEALQRNLWVLFRARHPSGTGKGEHTRHRRPHARAHSAHHSTKDHPARECI